MMTAMLRPATPADRPDLIALALAEDAAFSGAPEVSGEEAGELIDRYRPRVVFERDGRVVGYAAVDEGGATIVLADPGDPVPALAALVAWLGERGHHEVDAYAADARRIAWLQARGFTHRRSSFDLERGIDPPTAPAVWPSGVAVARYRPGEDADAVHALVYVDAAWAEVPGHAQRSPEAWRSMLTPDHRGWVARRDGRPVGWVVGRVFGDGRGWIEQLAVARSARGRGLGRALLLHSARRPSRRRRDLARPRSAGRERDGDRAVPRRRLRGHTRMARLRQAAAGLAAVRLRSASASRRTARRRRRRTRCGP
jgi:ribosomal protein S18 acetylase RimI-like enzyme